MKLKQNSIINKTLLSIVGILLLAAGCGGGATPTQTKPVTLTVWMTFEESENFQPFIEAYKQKHPNVDVVYTKKNVDTYEQDLLNALAAGTGPDIFSIHNDWLPKYLDKVAPAPDKTFILKDYKNTFVDALVSDFTVGSKIYGTALGVDSLGLYYNKDLLGTSGIAVPPKTWDELASQVRKIKRSDGKGYFTRSGAALGTSANVNRAVDILYLFMLQKGVQPFSQDRLNATFGQQVQNSGTNENPGEDGLSFYTSFADPGSENYNWNSRSDYSIDAFANGRAAFLFSYSYTRATLLSKNPNLNFDVTSVPQPNLDNPAVNFANYWGDVVSKQSKNPDVAWDFLKAMTSKDSLDSYYARNKQPSSRKDLIDLQIQDPYIGVFANANLTAKTFYKPDQVKLDEIFGQAIDNIILKGLEVRDALDQAARQADTLTRNFQ